MPIQAQLSYSRSVLISVELNTLIVAFSRSLADINLIKTMPKQNWGRSAASSAMLPMIAKRTLSINQNGWKIMLAYYPLALMMRIQSEAVEQMTPLSIKLATNSSSSMAPGFISEKISSKLNLMKTTLKLKDLKTMKARPKVNFKKYGVFFMGNLNTIFFNRSGLKEQCIISSFPKGHPLKMCAVFERTQDWTL